MELGGRRLGREGWMEIPSCPIFNFLLSDQTAHPGTRAVSLVRNLRSYHDRSGPFDLALNSLGISATS